MTRLLRVLGACVVCSVIASVVACGDGDSGVTIRLFQATPDAIAAGQSTKLVFAVDPADAKVTITGVGDVTGKVDASVSPTATTTYQLTATSGSSSATGDVTVTVAASVPRLVLTIPANTNAGNPVGIDVTVKDQFDNAVPGYTGTVTFTSSDSGPGAVVPAPITFAAGAGGVGHTSATFVTLGAQTITASDGASSAATGSAVSTVHGLVYSAPTAGRVRLVANAAQSNAQVVQLDLIANERLEMASFFGGGPGSFAAGMNLPLDTTRVGADATLFRVGNTLVVTLTTGTPPVQVQIPPIGVARIGDDHVLYTAVSRKRLPTTIFTQGTEVRAGEVFYSIRLRLASAGTVGTVFDGTRPSPLYRASVRDQYGDDFVNQGDFGIGKLEIR